MAFLPAIRASFMKWIAGLVFLFFISGKETAEGATYREKCMLPSDCLGKGLTCTSSFLCMCSEGYTHFSGECEEDGNEVFVPDLTFSSVSKFETEMTADDLDNSRYQEIKNQLELELTGIFQNLTGFKFINVTFLKISPGSHLLEAGWTARLNREDPKFVNATPKEIGDIVRPELEEASKRYKEDIHIDTRKRSQPMTKDSFNKLALGLGLGLGITGAILIGVFVTVVIVLHRRKNVAKTAKSISDQSSSCESGRSSKMDPDNYQYSVFTKDGFSIPPHYAKFTLPSIAGSVSADFMESSDKIPFHKLT